MNELLQHSISIAAARERVWHAITESEHIKQWWGADGYAEISELRAGAPIKFDTGDGLIFATIRLVDPLHEFIYEWPPGALRPHQPGVSDGSGESKSLPGRKSSPAYIFVPCRSGYERLKSGWKRKNMIRRSLCVCPNCGMYCRQLIS